METTFNWGIVGLGKIAHHFVRDLSLLPNCRVLAVASRSRQRADAFAQTYEIPVALGTYEALAAQPDLHAVYIATPHPDHASLTIFFLERGIPVLCEKPLAMNGSEVNAMIESAQRNKVFLMEALWTRFLPTTQKMLQLLQQGAIGEANSLHADFGFRAERNPQSRLFNPALGGGALLDIGIYPVFLALLLWGSPDCIQKQIHFGSTGVDEELGILFQYSKGRMAQLHASFRHTSPCRATLYGSKGRLELHPRWHESRGLSLYPHDGPESLYYFERRAKGYHYQQAHVMQCIRQGLSESPLLPLQFSKNLMTLLDEIRRS